MIRPNWHEIFINIALEVSKRSTCAKTQVGSVIVKDDRIISMGFNGVAEGTEHCYDIFKKEYDHCYRFDSFEKYIETEELKKKHRKFSELNEIHAETNAILFAAKSGVSTNNSKIYTTWSPCSNCAKSILQSGIKEVYYYNKYRKIDGINFLKNNGIKCEQVKIIYKRF